MQWSAVQYSLLKVLSKVCLNTASNTYNDTKTTSHLGFMVSRLFSLDPFNYISVNSARFGDLYLTLYEEGKRILVAYFGCVFRLRISVGCVG